MDTNLIRSELTPQNCSSNLTKVRTDMYPAILLPGTGDDDWKANMAGELKSDLPAAEPLVGIIGCD